MTQEDSDDLLNYNYPLRDEDFISLAIELKQDMRNSSYNFAQHKEIARYSDKYLITLSEEEIAKSLDIEILGPELMKMFGKKVAKNVEVVDNDIEHDEDEIIDLVDEGSVEANDDYEQQYFDDEELVFEKNEEYDPFF